MASFGQSGDPATSPTLSTDGMSDATARLLGVLETYISSINARAIFSRALKSNRVDAARASADELKAVVRTIERSLQIFAVASVRAEVMEKLWAAAGGQPNTAASVVSVSDERDVSRARLMARSMCVEIGVESYAMQRIATAVSELARNIAKYSKGGSVEMRVEQSPRRFVILATDSGPGIANLQEVLAGGYRSKTGMGLGILGTKRMATHFEIDSSPRGTRVQAEIAL